VNNRTRAELDRLIGLFVNVLIIRTNLGRNQTFLELLEQVCELTLSAYSNQDLPFEKLVEKLGHGHSLSHTPLHQTIFMMEENFYEDLKFPGLKVEPIDADIRTAKVELLLCLEETRDGMVGKLQYNTGLFDISTVEQIVGPFKIFLAKLAEDPQRRLSELRMLSEVEEEQLLVAWNNTAKEYPREKSIQELFEAQAAIRPAAIAVVAGEDRISYGELNCRANQLAHYLRRAGVGPDVPVGICVERSIEMVVGLLGILKAGGAYLPLDPAYPKKRLLFMLEDACPALVIGTAQSLEALAAYRGQLLALDSCAHELALEQEADLAVETSPDNLAYITYTSGSTGEPKGVGVLHRGVVRLLFDVGYVETGRDKNFLQAAPLSFDASTLEIWGALLHGGQCVLLEEKIPTAEVLGRAIREHSITTMWLTAALYNS